jgi:UPF0716 protein FxsA
MGGLIAAVLIEIAIFILVGKMIGVFNTLLLILLTSIIGITVAKKQGVQSVQNIRNSIAEGMPLGVPMIDTFMIFVGGILLALPGFLTDLLGFAFIFSFTRKMFKPIIYYWLRKKLKNGQVFIIHR